MTKLSKYYFTNLVGRQVTANIRYNLPPGAIDAEKNTKNPVKTGISEKKPRPRDSIATRASILAAATQEFSAKGYNGARIEKIVALANCNVRMAYHYFGRKEALYIAVLEHAYSQVREREAQLDLTKLEPVEGMKVFIESTFDHISEHPEFVGLMTAENLQKGRFLMKSKQVPEATIALVEGIRNLLKRGKKTAVFHSNVDPIQIYVTILSLSYLHISNRYTLSIMFQKDLHDTAWLLQRREHVVQVILGYLRGSKDEKSPGNDALKPSD